MSKRVGSQQNFQHSFSFISMFLVLTKPYYQDVIAQRIRQMVMNIYSIFNIIWITNWFIKSHISENVFFDHTSQLAVAAATTIQKVTPHCRERCSWYHSCQVQYRPIHRSVFARCLSLRKKLSVSVKINDL